MICIPCRNAADTKNAKGHDKCEGKGSCDCQHRVGNYVSR